MSRSTPTFGEKVPIDMTPMIDIVFQLLTFFIMTLQIAAQEGDFMVRMPLSTGVPHEPSPETAPTVRLRLHATMTGDLAEVRLNDVSYGSGAAAWKGIQNQIVQLLGDGTRCRMLWKWSSIAMSV
nr:biopolymer transporter ExbD [Pirellula staleyi]